MFTIQKATAEDVPEIKKLLFITWTFAYKDTMTPDEIKKVTSKWHAPEQLLKEINYPRNVFLIATVDNKIVGVCNAVSKQKGKKAYIERLHVLPDYHRQGIGSQLVKEVLASIPQAICATLEVEKNNNRAYKFYTALGFKPVGEKVYVVDGIHMNCNMMEKMLNRTK